MIKRILNIVFWVLFFGGTITLLAFAVGMVVVAMRPDRGHWWLLYALVFTVQAVHLVYWTNARMRAPLTPVIALFAAACFSPRANQASTKPIDTVSKTSRGLK